MRPPCVDKNGLKKGAWSEEEDNKLRAYILRYGHWNWRLLPKFAGLARCGKSCRLRWVNYLKPGVKRGNYSKEEEDLIAKLHDQLGNKWSAISAKLPGRTDNEIKNYWHTHLKKRSKRIAAVSELMGRQPRKSFLVPENFIQSSSQISVCKNTEEASSACRDVASEALKFSRNLKNFQASDIHILESSGSNSWNLGPVNWDSDDSASSSRSAQEPQRSFLSEEPVPTETSELFQDQNDERASSSDSFAGFEESFWSEPFLVDTSYSQDDSFSPLDEGGFFSGYLFT
ncbi:hypothetical protein Pfo_016206 [Paulownia fortunei]|nr:hypothetical protein Pfo_016206 [Paulownia fortunei]